MAMIEIGCEEFVDGLIVKKARGETVDEEQRVLVKRDLMAIADRAVDGAIMRAVLQRAMDQSITKAAMDKVHDLMQLGSKANTEKYLRRILPDLDQVIVDELIRMEEMYLRSPA
jgi:hypothetical protein